jgi:hypothetical protein
MHLIAEEMSFFKKLSVASGDRRGIGIPSVRRTKLDTIASILRLLLLHQNLKIVIDKPAKMYYLLRKEIKGYNLVICIFCL